uniref:Carbohydrate sulfotransferase n=1 Tax=Amphilophus citrinellus TaxID=61819 RepID=A0A3Q0QWJ4_AMPCI
MSCPLLNIIAGLRHHCINVTFIVSLFFCLVCECGETITFIHLSVVLMLCLIFLSVSLTHIYCLNAEAGLKTGRRPGKSRRSPLPTFYNGDQQPELLAAHTSLQGRRELLEQACLGHMRKRRVLSPEDLKHLIVDDKHSLIYCYVPKVACTNWKRVLMVLTSDGRYTDPLAIPANEAHVAGNLRTLSEFSVAEINQRLRSYLKFIFVREPFERLVSAYRNKFTRRYNTFLRVAQSIKSWDCLV